MVKQFAQALRHRCQIKPGMSLLIGVSGGADSVALLLLCRSLASEWQLTLRAAHLDHSLYERSREAADWVVNLCARLGLPCETERVAVAELATRRGLGLEEAARFARHGFLHSQADLYQCQAIVLGHHRGDQAETVLLRLLRGSGSSGLSGMAARQGRLARPLLELRKEQLEAYLRGLKQDWLTDPGNQSPEFTRNRIRHQLLPLLESFNPRIEATLAGLTERLSAEEDYWSALVSTEFSTVSRGSDDTLMISVARLVALHPALRKRLYRKLLLEVRGTLLGISAAHIEAIERLTSSPRPQAAIDLPGAWVARRYDRLLWGHEPLPAREPFHCLIQGPGSYPLPDGRRLLVTLDRQPAGETLERVEFAAAKTGFPFQVRSVRPGDRFRPSGMRGRKKLKDYFIDVKLTLEERAEVLVVEGAEILWLLGRRRCAGFTVDSAMDAVIRMVLLPAENGQTPC